MRYSRRQLVSLLTNEKHTAAFTKRHYAHISHTATLTCVNLMTPIYHKSRACSRLFSVLGLGLVGGYLQNKKFPELLHNTGEFFVLE